MKLRKFINEDKVLDKARRESEKKLKQLRLKIISNNDLKKWNRNRNKGGGPNKAVDINKLDWIDYGNYLEKSFYIVDPSGEDFGVLRKAFAYYEDDGTVYDFIITDEYNNEL